MSNFVILKSNDDLQHHGIKGQKWGVRRFQNPDGTRTAAGKAREREGSGKRPMSERQLKKQAIARYRAEALEGESKAGKAWAKLTGWDKDYAKAKYAADKKAAKVDRQKKAVKEYSALADKASKLTDKSDDLFREAKEMHKGLGSNVFQRAREVSKAQKGQGSEAAKKYIEKWNKAENLGNQGYDAWIKAKAVYRETGKTKLERIINNFKYDPIVKERKQPWDEKPSNKQPWDEKPSKKNKGNI